MEFLIAFFSWLFFSGKIAYYTLPPEKKAEEVHLGAELVATMSKEFDLDGLEEEEKMMIDEMPDVDPAKASIIDSSADAPSDDDMDEQEEEADSTEQSLPRLVVNLDPVDKKTKSDKDDEWESDDSTKQLDGNQQWGKRSKKVQKRRLKIKTKRGTFQTNQSINQSYVLIRLQANKNQKFSFNQSIKSYTQGKINWETYILYIQSINQSINRTPGRMISLFLY